MDILLRLDKTGYRGDYSFEAFNDDDVNLPIELVCERAQKARIGWPKMCCADPDRCRVLCVFARFECFTKDSKLSVFQSSHQLK